MAAAEESQAQRGLQRLAGSNLLLRSATAAVAVPVLVVLILVGGELWAAVVALTLVVAVFEYGAAVGLRSRDPLLWLTAAGAAALPAVALIDDIPQTWPLTALALALLAAPIVAGLGGRVGDPPAPALAPQAKRLAFAALGVLYFGWLGSFAVLLRQAPSGEEWVLLAVFAIMAADTGAYVVGRSVGRHALAPRLSLNKTVEGTVGALAAGFAAVLLIDLLLDLDVTIWKMVILALILPVMAVLGDLAESTLKRSLSVKDLGRLIPGHGGVPDRLDSLLFGIPTVYLFMQWVVL